MSPSTMWRDFIDWLTHLPVAFAYRIIWLAARLNLGSARDVYSAMWDANLDLPAITPTPDKKEPGA